MSTSPGPKPDTAAAEQFLAEERFVWHQRFELAQGVYTPGVSDMGWLLHTGQLPDDLSGQTVLDIGTSNGGAAFIAERRGAKRVVALDIHPGDWFGILRLKDFLGSEVEYVQGSVYELPALLGERFDFVLFLGVLYHLRHPLLALDAVRSVTEGVALVETAVADHELGDLRSSSLVRFYRDDELGRDPSNWFAPTVNALLDWCSSSGLQPELLGAWPTDAPTRCLVRATPTADEPEYVRVSNERSLVALGEGRPSNKATRSQRAFAAPPTQAAARQRPA
jgi:tRNA (mo5U34)-methyltransferase